MPYYRSLLHRLPNPTIAVLLAALLSACAAAPDSRIVDAAPPAPVVPPSSPDVVSEEPTHSSGPLGQRIDAFLAAQRFAHAEWGIDVVDARNGRVLYAHQPRKLFVPASNVKLYTAALIFDRLGADTRINTALYATAPVRGGVVHGDLVLYGRGDPSLGDPAVAPDSLYWADRLAGTLAARGIQRVTGDVVGDDTFFAGPAFSSGWETGDLSWSYAPRPSALTVDGNLITLEVTRNAGRCCSLTLEPAGAARLVNLTHDLADADAGIRAYRPPGSFEVYVYGALPPAAPGRRITLTAPDPALLAARKLRNALAERGIRVDGVARARHWPRVSAHTASDVVLAQIASPPIAELVRHMLKRSDNLYAQLLLLQTGVAFARTGVCQDREQAPVTTEGWALCAMRAMLARAGIDPALATLDEGSGLSRHNLVAPAATTSLLLWVQRQAFATAFRQALPIAGEDGTLAYRLSDGPASHTLRAKTGTLEHVHALSGYATNAAGEPLVFALYLNRYLRPRDAFGRSVPPSPRDDLDAVARMIVASGNDQAGTDAPVHDMNLREPIP